MNGIDSKLNKTNGHEEKPNVTDKPCLLGQASFYQKVFFGWCLPIINKARSEKLSFEDLGGLTKEDVVEVKVKKVEDAYFS